MKKASVPFPSFPSFPYKRQGKSEHGQADSGELQAMSMKAACTIPVLSLALSSCGHVPSGPVRFQRSDLRLSFENKIRTESAASVIVVGTVVKTRSVGKAIRSLFDPDIFVQLTAVELHPDQVIKGSPGDGLIEFYYYAFSPDSRRSLGIPYYMPVVGQRRMFFLDQVNGHFRSVGDVADYTLPVPSGLHERHLCRNKTLGCCLAETLLVPGKQMDPEWFSNRLAESTAVATILCSRSAAVGLIARLRKSPDPRVAEAAEQILADARASGERIP
jgi:hypothetical protein